MTKTLNETIISVVRGSFHAVLDEQPGPGKQHKFFATVEIEVEVDWKVELVSAVPQGINPLDKLLRFHVTKPTGPHSNAIAPRMVRYDEVPAKENYTHATLEDGANTTTVKVKRVV